MQHFALTMVCGSKVLRARLHQVEHCTHGGIFLLIRGHGQLKLRSQTQSMWCVSAPQTDRICVCGRHTQKSVCSCPCQLGRGFAKIFSSQTSKYPEVRSDVPRCLFCVLVESAFLCVLVQ